MGDGRRSSDGRQILNGKAPGVSPQLFERACELLRGLGGDHGELLAWALVIPEAVRAAHRRETRLVRELHRYGFFLHPDDQSILFASALGTPGSVRILRTDARPDTPAALYERLLATPLCRNQLEGFERCAKEQNGGTAEAQVRARLAVCQALEPLVVAAQVQAAEHTVDSRAEPHVEGAFEDQAREGWLAAYVEAALSPPAASARAGAG